MLSFSAIFYHSEEQRKIAQQVKERVQKEHYANQTVVTQLEPAGNFWCAEEHHQQYVDR
jgi:peptide-methionine (S)-S-oxide reductase